MQFLEFMKMVTEGKEGSWESAIAGLSSELILQSGYNWSFQTKFIGSCKVMCVDGGKIILGPVPTCKIIS